MRIWFRGRIREDEHLGEEELAATRWRAHNARALVKGCCKCGKPATHVRSVFGTVGGVPAGIFTCADHVYVNVYVNGWSLNEDGEWIPSAEFTPSELAWISQPRPIPTTHRGEQSAETNEES